MFNVASTCPGIWDVHVEKSDPDPDIGTTRLVHTFGAPRMIDLLSLALTHALLLLAAWRLITRPELDDENA